MSAATFWHLLLSLSPHFACRLRSLVTWVLLWPGQLQICQPFVCTVIYFFRMWSYAALSWADGRMRSQVWQFFSPHAATHLPCSREPPDTHEQVFRMPEALQQDRVGEDGLGWNSPPAECRIPSFILPWAPGLLRYCFMHKFSAQVTAFVFVFLLVLPQEKYEASLEPSKGFPSVQWVTDSDWITPSSRRGHVGVALDTAILPLWFRALGPRESWPTLCGSMCPFWLKGPVFSTQVHPWCSCVWEI